MGSNTSTGRELQQLLKVPVDSYDDVLTVLKLENYSSILKHFDYDGRKSLAVYLLQAILDKNEAITSWTQVYLL